MEIWIGLNVTGSLFMNGLKIIARLRWTDGKKPKVLLTEQKIIKLDLV